LAALLEQNKLESLIVKAIAQAKVQGYPVLLSYSQDWPECDGLKVLAKTLELGAKSGWFFWEKSELRLVGSGVAIAIENVRDRFQVTKEFGQNYLAKAVIGGETSLGRILPLGLAGFSFHDRLVAPDQINEDQSWWQFPQFRVYVPGWLLRQVPGHNILSLNFLISEDSLVSEIWTEIQKKNQELTILNNSIPNNSIQISAIDLSTSSNSITNSIPNSISFTEVEGDRSWPEMVEQAKELIEEGQLSKIVLARSLEVRSLHQIDPILVLERLRRSYPECVSFGINLGGSANFVGATPEFLLQFSSKNGLTKLKSDALAGSIQRGNNPAQDLQLGSQLLQSKKNLLEHQIVVGSISDRLQQMGISVQPISPPHLLQLENVQHLRTVIEAYYSPSEQFQALEVLAHLHPTAAMGGEPREKALEIVREWEASDRGWYAAPIGWFSGDQNQESGSFVVGIRSGYIEGNRARIFAGAGIVADSQLDTELEETRLKFAALLQAIAGV
jgi:menaquinone-specific isochorismate synthase